MARSDAAQPSRRVGATKLRHGRGSGANARVKGAVAGPAPIAVRRNRRRGSRRGSIPRVRSSAALGAHPARGAATAERLRRQKQAGRLRDDVPGDVLRTYLELVLDGLVARLASGDDPEKLSAVLDLVEDSVRQP